MPHTIEFQDRHDAGVQLAKALRRYKKHKNAHIVALPRGGLFVAAPIAEKLELPLDVLLVKKIAAPRNKEVILGAMTESGIFTINSVLTKRLSNVRVKLMLEEAKSGLRERKKYYRDVKKRIPVTGKTIIIVDDGVTTGATMKTAIEALRKEYPQEIVVAAPVAPKETIQELRTQVDDVICLRKPEKFEAVSTFYHNFLKVSDEEALRILAP